MKKIFQLNPRNEMFKFTVNKLLQMLISRNVSVLSNKGSPTRKSAPLPAVQPYYDEQSELIESQGVVKFRGEKLVLPLSLRKDMLNQLQSSHIGIGGCVRRAREFL